MLNQPEDKERNVASDEPTMMLLRDAPIADILATFRDGDARQMGADLGIEASSVHELVHKARQLREFE